MRRPDWHKPGRAKPDLRGANLSGAFLAGADLREARMEGALFREARMEGADLIKAQLERADLSWARMKGADLSGVWLVGADLVEARMERADLSEALLTGTPDQPSLLWDTNLSAAVNDGGALRFVDLTRIGFDAATDFRNAFLDGSVTYTDDFARQMGGDLSQPCQWIPQTLSDEEFYGRWRGWLEHASSSLPTLWQLFAPDAWRDVPAIPPPDGCAWKTGPMPGADTAPDP